MTGADRLALHQLAIAPRALWLTCGGGIVENAAKWLLRRMAR
jgi:hypothetical protein